MTTSVAQRLSSSIETAKRPASEAGTTISKTEASAIMNDLLTNGVSMADAESALASAPGLTRSERQTLSAAAAHITQVRTHGAVFASLLPMPLAPVIDGQPVAVGRAVKPENLAKQIPTLLQSALTELKLGRVAQAARLLAPLVDANGQRWEVRSGSTWSSGGDNNLAAVLATLGVPGPQATKTLTLVKQTQVHSAMEAVMRRPPAFPPNAQDLRDYGAAMARQNPRPSAQAFADAYMAYAEAFHRHPGHVDYQSPLTVDSALPPSRRVESDGHITNSCVGYALIANEFFSAAGFKCQFAHAAHTTRGTPGHAMLYAARGNDAVLVSDALTYLGSGGTTERNRLVNAGLAQTTGTLKANHHPVEFTARLSLE